MGARNYNALAEIPFASAMVDLEPHRKDSYESQPLFILGRRMERLFLLGVVLIVLVFVEMYVTTAAKQISEDRSLAAISTLLDRITSEQQSLTLIFQAKPIKPLPAAPRTRAQLKPEITPQTSERSQLAAETRKALGLPEPPPPRPRPERLKPDMSTSASGSAARSLSPAAPLTYAESLNKIVGEIVVETKVPPEDLAKFNDPNRTPSELIAMLQKQKDAMESRPTAVWGIQTPRLLQVQYAGLDYKIPFLPLSVTLAVALLPMMVGWIGAFYMTRQRELIYIADLQDYKLAFPHILNSLPVRFKRFEAVLKNAPKRPNLFAFAIRTMSAVTRSIVLLLFLTPMLFAYGYSIYQLWDMNDRQLTWPFEVGGTILVVPFVLVLGLILQEWVALHNKLFDE
jgi:hypothetical protein